MDRRTELHILNILRKGTITWHVRNEVLNEGRRKRFVGRFKNGKEKFIWERACDSCGQWYALKDNILEVDHIDPVGSYNGDIHEYAHRMYCDRLNLQALCDLCHKRKSASDVASIRYYRKIKETEMSDSTQDDSYLEDL